MTQRQVVFISVQALYIAAQNDTLLVALDTVGRVWTKLMFGSGTWTCGPVIIEPVH